MLKVHICFFFLKVLNQDKQIDMKKKIITSPIKKNFNFVTEIKSVHKKTQ